MAHFAHPSADALLASCSACQWPHASRHWRDLPAAVRDGVAADALGLGLAALSSSGPLSRAQAALADEALRPLAARCADPRSKGLPSPESAKSIAIECCLRGLWLSLAELAQSSQAQPAPPAVDRCVDAWAGMHFSDDARVFLERLSGAEQRAALDALALLLAWRGPRDSPGARRAREACERAASRFWPDGRDQMAAKASLALAPPPPGAAP